MNHSFLKIIFSAILIFEIAIPVGAEEMDLAARKPKKSAPVTRPAPLPPDPNQYEGVVHLDNISRRAGGTQYLFDFEKTASLVRMELRSTLGKVKVQSTTLITKDFERIAVKELSNSIILGDSIKYVSSENLNPEQELAQIEIVTEAIGGNGSIDIAVFSTKEQPSLVPSTKQTPETICKINNDQVLKTKLESVQLWASRVETSPAGSVQEKFAGKQLMKFVNSFVGTIKATDSFISAPYLVTLLFHLTGQYESSRSGGLSETAFKTLATESYNVLLFAIQNELPCRKFSNEELMKIMMDFNIKRKESSSGSRAENFYSMMLTRVKDFIPDRYRKDLANRNLNFKQAVAEGSLYYKQFITDEPNDILKSVHRDLSAMAFAAAESSLIREVKRMDIEEIYQLIVEYQAKYNDPNSDFPQATALRYLTILSQESNLIKKILWKHPELIIK